VERNQFTFYSSFWKAVARIKNKSARCDAYDAICRYAITGEEPDVDSLPDSAAIVFEMIKPNLVASRRKAENGSLGGTSKQTASKPEANVKQTEANGKQNEANSKQGEIETKNKSKNKNKNKNKNKCYNAGDFDLFWDAYPRKEGKQKAADAFAKVEVPVETLLSAIEAQKKSPQWTKDGGQFIPHPATWLNGKRWEDQVTAGSSSAPYGATGEMGSAEREAIARLMGGGI
jgi:hypothetical protein